MSGVQIRLGQVSTIDYENGMISVQFPDLDGAVSNEMPMLTFNSEYKMPNIDDTVAVMNLSNGSSIGIVLGTFWNESNKPPAAGKNVYHKCVGESTYFHYDNGELKIHAPKIVIESDTNTVEF